LIKAVLVDLASGKSLHSEEYHQESEAGRVLLTTTIHKHYGFFKTAAYTVQGTFEQITPPSGFSLELTDLIVTFEKKNLGVVTINLHDGTNTAPLMKVTLTDAPVNMVSNFSGRWRGWKDAHIDVVISGADSIGNVSIGYLKHDPNDTLTYNQWTAARS
jgi:hypothetical protein